jgi:hypothetical protein
MWLHSVKLDTHKELEGRKGLLLALDGGTGGLTE